MVQDFPTIFYTFAALLSLLYVLQLVWFRGILHVLRCGR